MGEGGTPYKGLIVEEIVLIEKLTHILRLQETQVEDAIQDENNNDIGMELQMNPSSGRHEKMRINFPKCFFELLLFHVESLLSIKI